MQHGRWHWATENLGASSRSLDRVVVRVGGDALLIVLADGAGGMAGGASAANAVIAAAASWPAMDALASDGGVATTWLEDLDRQMTRSDQGGQSTAVVVASDGERVAGASVGDSMAWTCGKDGLVELTGAQRRKPLLGSGQAIAIPFVGHVKDRRVLVASDGLWKYADVERISAAASLSDLQGAAARLVELVQLSNGTLQDDVSLALAEHRRA